MPLPPLAVGELSDTFARYRRALARNRPGQRPTLADTEEVLTSRVALYDCLVSDGWEAPDQVTQQVERDRLVLVMDSGPSTAQPDVDHDLHSN